MYGIHLVPSDKLRWLERFAPVKLESRLLFNVGLTLIAFLRTGSWCVIFADQVGIPVLYHFIYKSKSTAQYTSPEIEAPYVDQEEQDR